MIPEINITEEKPLWIKSSSFNSAANLFTTTAVDARHQKGTKRQSMRLGAIFWSGFLKEEEYKKATTLAGASNQIK